jgi:AAHS family 4-hydroxybenzoate transporter-like MFS transporter
MQGVKPDTYNDTETDMNETSNAEMDIDIDALIDAAPINGFIVAIVFLCAGVVLLDGFDTLAISYVAPAISEAWRLPKEAFGPIFAAHYIGAAMGATAFGMLADRYGRRPVIMASTAMFGIFALLTPFTYGFLSLLLVRAMTGIGLGGALSNVISLVAEYAPQRARATLVSIMYAAFPIGGVLGGPLSAYVLAHYGWQAVFVIGGVTPLVLLMALIFALPESARFLMTHGAPQAKVSALIRRLALNLPASATFTLNAPAPSNRQPVREIFSHEYAKATVLLWIASFVTQLVIVYVITWMPTLLKAAGLPLSRAIITSVMFSVGGIVGSLLLARLIDTQKSYRTLVGAYILASLAIGLIGFSTVSVGWMFAVVCLAGIMIVGAQVNLSAYSSTVYPTSIRSTGIGWIIGVGRVGAILGALVGTAFVSAGLSLETQYMLAGIPALIAGLAVKFARTRHQTAT